MRVYWQQMEEIDQQEFNDLTEAELDMLLAEDNVELVDSRPMRSVAVRNHRHHK